MEHSTDSSGITRCLPPCHIKSQPCVTCKNYNYKNIQSNIKPLTWEWELTLSSQDRNHEGNNRFDHNRISCLYKKGKQKKKNITMTIVDYQCIVIYICGSVGLPLDKYTKNRQMKMRS